MWLQELREVAQSGRGCPAGMVEMVGQVEMAQAGGGCWEWECFSARGGCTGWEKCQQEKVFQVRTGAMDKDPGWAGRERLRVP